MRQLVAAGKLISAMRDPALPVEAISAGELSPAGNASPVSPAVAASPQPLDYGRSRRPWRPRGRHVASWVVLAACAGGAWFVGREARDRTQSLLYARQAAAYVEPAPTVTYEPDPTLAAALIDAGTHRPLELSGDAPSTPPAAKIEPESFGLFRAALARQSLEAVGAMVFLHELTTPGGVRRIVAVHYLPGDLNAADVSGAGLVARIFEPGGFLRPPDYLADAHARLLVSADAPDLPPVPSPQSARSAPPVRWFAGQPDEGNPSHFTVDYELGGVRGTVDGYLTNDGRTVRMKARSNADEPAEPDPAVSQVALPDPHPPAGPRYW